MERFIFCGRTQIQAVALAALLRASAFAQTAGMMSFQGLIRDTNGVAAQGAITLQLQIVDAGNTVIDASGNGSVGAEDTFIVNTTAEQGIVSLKYGPIAPLAFNGSQRFLRVTVTSPGGYPALTPVEIVTPPAIAEQLNARGTGLPALVTTPSGLVGVGDVDAASLSQKLNIHSLSNFGAGLSLRSRDVGGRNWSVLSSGSGNTGGPGSLQFLLDSSPIVTTTPSGFVGVGTTAPNERMTVAGSVALDGFNFFYARATPGSNSNATSLGFSGQIGGVLTLSNNGNNEIRAGRGATGGQLRFFVNNTADPFTASDGIEAITIGVNGNVGIRSASPLAPLQIGAPAFSGEAIRLSSAQYGIGLFSVSGTSTNAVTGVFGNASYAASGVALGTLSGTTFSPQLLVTRSGEVGIGTSSPIARLDVLDPSASGRHGLNVLANCDAGFATLRVHSDHNADPALALLSVSQQANQRLFVRMDGNVGIGTNAPATRLHVVGNVTANCGVLTCSDRRFKTNFRDFEGAIGLVQKLRPVHFDWRSAEFPDREFPSTPQIGFIAQEVESLVPEVVLKGADDFYSVDYGRLTPLLTAAIQELSVGLSDRTAELLSELAERDQRIEEQQREIDTLRERLDKIERLLIAAAGSDLKEQTK